MIGIFTHDLIVVHIVLAVSIIIMILYGKDRVTFE